MINGGVIGVANSAKTGTWIIAIGGEARARLMMSVEPELRVTFY